MTAQIDIPVIPVQPVPETPQFPVDPYVDGETVMFIQDTI